MKWILFPVLLCGILDLPAQSYSMKITNDLNSEQAVDPLTRNLYELLGAQHFTATFDMPSADPYEVVLVLREVTKEGTLSRDTLINSPPWRTKIQGGFPWHPGTDGVFVAQRTDSVTYKLHTRLGMAMTKNIRLWPNHGYQLNDGAGSYGRPVQAELGKPTPVLVLTQPYPDPPPPKQAVVQRYCFGTDTPPDQWPAKYGVPHLYILELTLVSQ